MRVVQQNFSLFEFNDEQLAYTASFEPIEGMKYVHLGIQLPYRPFVAYRQNNSPGNNVDLIINDNNFIVNLPGILEFDEMSLDYINIVFRLANDGNSIQEVLRGAIVDAGIEQYRG